MAQLRDSSASPAGTHPRRAPLTLPAYLRLADSPPHGVGVFAAAPLPLGLRVGPYEVRAVRTADSDAGGYSWRVRHGRLVDACDETPLNWMRFVNCTPDAARRNLALFQHRGALYCRTVAPVVVGDELLVYYGDDYASSTDVDSYYDYRPPKEEPESEFAATDVRGGDGDAGDYVRIGIDNYCDYGPPDKDLESKFVDVYYHPLKEEPEPGLGDGNGDADDISRCYDRDPVKKEPEPDLAATEGGSGEDGARDDRAPSIRVNTDDCYYNDPPKEDVEPEFVDVCYDPLKEEPEPELAATSDDAVADGSRDVGYDCSHCRISLSTREFKVEHELRCTVRMKQKELESQVTKLYHCGYCRCPFINKEFKEQHQQRYCPKRPVEKRKDSNGTYFECDKCKFVTKWKNCFERHVLNHNKDNSEWFTCTQCSYKTVHRFSMSKHMNIHCNTFSCCCPICGRSFRKKHCLDDHLLRRHSDESDEVSKLVTSKTYTCDICDQYSTTRKTDFNKHLTVIHNKGVGCQKYECPRCPYSTFSKGNLTKHSKTHAGQKDYQCAVCKKQFTRKTHLDSHVLSNHADNVDLMKAITSKIHSCKSCSFRTVLLTNLKKHVRSKHV